MKQKVITIIIIMVLLGTAFVPVSSGSIRYQVNLTMYKVKILDDHDDSGNGEIFISVQINEKDQSRYPDKGKEESLSDNEIWNLEFSRRYILNRNDELRVEIRDEDGLLEGGGDDSLGYVNFYYPWNTTGQEWHSTVSPSDAEILVRLSSQEIIIPESDDPDIPMWLKILIIIGIVIFIIYLTKSWANTQKEDRRMDRY